LFAGRLTRERRLDLLLAAVGRLASRPEPVLLSVAGDVPFRPELAAHAERLGIPSPVRLLRNLPSHTLWRERAPAAPAPHPPSPQDTWRLCPGADAAGGRPSVFGQGKDSALPELVREGRPGCGAPPAPDARAPALARLLDDPVERARLAAQAGERAQEYDWDR